MCGYDWLLMLYVSCLMSCRARLGCVLLSVDTPPRGALYFHESVLAVACACVAFAISSEYRSVCVALVAGAGRRCTYTVCTYLLLTPQ